MEGQSIEIPKRKRIALVAHDNKKKNLMEWVEENKSILVQHELLGTGTTGEILEEYLGVRLIKLESGPLGGDLQIGAMVSSNEIDILIFFWDPLEPHPHDPDVKALLRIAVVWNIPLACNRSTADFLLHSLWMEKIYKRKIQNFKEYRGRLKASHSF